MQNKNFGRTEVLFWLAAILFIYLINLGFKPHLMKIRNLQEFIQWYLFHKISEAMSKWSILLFGILCSQVWYFDSPADPFSLTEWNFRGKLKQKKTFQANFSLAILLKKLTKERNFQKEWARWNLIPVVIDEISSLITSAFQNFNVKTEFSQYYDRSKCINWA